MSAPTIGVYRVIWGGGVYSVRSDSYDKGIGLKGAQLGFRSDLDDDHPPLKRLRVVI